MLKKVKRSQKLQKVSLNSKLSQKEVASVDNPFEDIDPFTDNFPIEEDAMVKEKKSAREKHRGWSFLKSLRKLLRFSKKGAFHEKKKKKKKKKKNFQKPLNECSALLINYDDVVPARQVTTRLAIPVLQHQCFAEDRSARTINRNQNCLYIFSAPSFQSSMNSLFDPDRSFDETGVTTTESMIEIR